MSNAYYYFAASLPIISWEGKLPMTSEEFLVDTKRLLSKEDGGLVEQLLKNEEGSETNNTVALAWIQFERNLRNEIVWFRAQRAHADPLKSIRGSKENWPQLSAVVQEASGMPNLLESERFLDRTRWQFLDDLTIGHYYDLEFLICYGLKLRILERHHDYKSSKGNETFDELRTAELPIDWVVPGI